MSDLGHQQPASSLSPGRLLPDAFRPFIVGFSEVTILNVCSHREQSYRRQNQHDGEGREAAMSRPSSHEKTCVLKVRFLGVSVILRLSLSLSQIARNRFVVG
jgi:hypothetical protein